MASLAMFKEKFSVWFKAQSESEQRLIKIAAVVFAIFVVFNLVTAVNQAAVEAEQNLKRQTELNLWAQEQINAIKTASRNPSSGNNTISVTQGINRTAKRFNIKIERLQPQGDGNVKVSVEEVGFDDLMNWLVELNDKYQISALNIDFAKGEQSGMVALRRLELGR